jgi:plasmid stabilization system protein ParE
MGRSKKKYQKKEEIAYKIRITKRAKNNISSSFNWYEEQREGLGSEFVLSVEACLQTLQRNPFAYRIRFLNSIRGAILQRFPFLVYYIIEDLTIVILAVLHFKQNQSRLLKKQTNE